MEKTYKIEVDCASCANLCEQAAKKVDGVCDVRINFMMQKMTVVFEDGANEDKVVKAILKACTKVESDFEIYAEAL